MFPKASFNVARYSLRSKYTDVHGNVIVETSARKKVFLPRADVSCSDFRKLFVPIRRGIWSDNDVAL